MKKFIYLIITFLLIFVSINNFNNINTLFASPENALREADLAEKLLIKLQQNTNLDDELESIYKYLDILCHENTNYYSYNIKEIEKLMESYRENIITTSRKLAQEEKYKDAVEFLESKSELFKDKSTINSLISYYSKFFIKDGLFYCDLEPKILAINKLIAYPSFAFTNNSNSENLDNLYLTTKEFSSLLNELYLNDYILIDIYNYIDISEEYPIKQDLYLPQNKKPLILLFNNINYYEEDNCFIDKFILDSFNKIATYSPKQTEKNQLSYSADFIPILENFIEENKDFSFNNARAIVSFDKSGNILGYNINKSNPNLNNDIINLKNLATNLKNLGYKFAYGNFSENFFNINESEEINFIKDNLLNIFSNINIYISPQNQNCLNNFYKDLNELDFKIFIDSSSKKISIKNSYVFLSYTKIDGKFLREKNFDEINLEKIYDHNNRTKVFK